jgi:hypothetical protein
MTPCARAVASSFARWAAPPTRMLVITKSAPSIAGSGVDAQVIFTPCAICAARSAITCWRSWSVS